MYQENFWDIITQACFGIIVAYGKAARDMRGQPVLKSVHIENFRCFQKLDINSLARVNVIAGRNSVGKTAALEAIYLVVGAENLGLAFKISQLRGLRGLEGEIQSVLELLWSPLFHQLETNKKIKIRAGLYNGREHRVELAQVSAASQTLNLNDEFKPGLSDQILELKFTDSYARSTELEMKFIDGELKIEPAPSTPPFASHYLSARRFSDQQEVANLFGRLVKSKQVDELNLVGILKIVEPRLLQLDVIPSAGTSMVYGDIGLDQMLPISLMGDGMERVIGIVLSIANASGGIVLIDEIENGIHYSALQSFWQAIGQAARTFNTQVIATTHSYECIREAHYAFKQSQDCDFLLHRLDRIGERVEAVTYDQEALDAALESEFEVR